MKSTLILSLLLLGGCEWPHTLTPQEMGALVKACEKNGLVAHPYYGGEKWTVSEIHCEPRPQP